jgi:hypothetical protein
MSNFGHHADELFCASFPTRIQAEAYILGWAHAGFPHARFRIIVDPDGTDSARHHYSVFRFV